MTSLANRPLAIDQAPPLVSEDFGRRYSRRRPWAVRNATFMLPTGSITALVGPNGAGKSTLLRACVGFERPDEGRVLIFGADPARNRPAAVRTTGFVPQASALYRGLTADDHFDLARAARRDFDRDYAARRVREAGLDPDREGGQLSGGEQAQVALALALGTRAPLLLLDEPLANLDPLARRDFLTALVDDVRERGATAILSSHIVTDIEQACDRLVILAGGRIVLNTSVDEARRTHRTMSADGANTRGRIGAFADHDGRRVTLVESDQAGHPASLEEIVLGHLAAARSDRGLDH